MNFFLSWIVHEILGPVVKHHTVKFSSACQRREHSPCNYVCGALPGTGPKQQDKSGLWVLRSLVCVLTDGAMPFHEAWGASNVIKTNLKTFCWPCKLHILHIELGDWKELVCSWQGLGLCPVKIFNGPFQRSLSYNSMILSQSENLRSHTWLDWQK